MSSKKKSEPVPIPPQTVDLTIVNVVLPGASSVIVTDEEALEQALLVADLSAPEGEQ